MENSTMTMDWSWIIALLIIGGFFSGNGFGFGGNSGTNQVTNDFLYTNLSNQVRDNANAISSTDRDVLENRYQNSLQTNTLQNQASVNALQAQNNQDACCCELKTAIHSEGEATRAMIQEQIIQTLRDKVADRDREALATGLSYSTSLSVRNAKDEILTQLGNYYPKTGINPYYVYQYSYGTNLQ